ncbi:MAG: hypothetical protein IJC59_02000 [Lachnospiraceae bacterium]|nr:hypothetical protein [Lachnospiraceae bacterium]
MANEIILDQKEEKKRIKAERKQLRAENKAQKKEAKRRAKELSYQESELEEEGSSLPIFLTTIGIIAIWLLIIVVLIKMDVGGFGSKVLTPVLKDVPVISKILPNTTASVQVDETGEPVDEYGGYTSLEEAVDQIRLLEAQLEQANSQNAGSQETITRLQAEIERLKTFEDSQVEFERIRTEFYEEVVYAENGPGADEYQKYYESIDPATAEVLYKQVVAQLQESAELQDYVQAYAEMKPKQAAGIFEEMTDNLELAARILGEMDSESRGEVLQNMDPAIAARLTKIMEPDT